MNSSGSVTAFSNYLDSWNQQSSASQKPADAKSILLYLQHRGGSEFVLDVLKELNISVTDANVFLKSLEGANAIQLTGVGLEQRAEITQTGLELLKVI